MSTRADKIRARRNAGGSGSKKPRPGERRTTASREMPPMVSRRGVMATPAATRGQRPARRRYNIALPMTAGAEMRLPSVPQMRVGARLLSFALAALLGWGLYFLWSAPQFTVAAAEVEGLARLTPNEVNTVLAVSGQSIFEIRPRQLHERLQAAFPELLDIRVRVGFPAVVNISAIERAPAIAWEHEGILTWVDAGGFAFLPRGEAEGVVYIIAHGLPPATESELAQGQQLLSPELARAILTLAAAAPEETTLAYDPRYGLGWQDPRGWQVYFGLQPTDMPARLAVYRTIVATLREEGIRPSLISVEYLHAPFYRED